MYAAQILYLAVLVHAEMSQWCPHVAKGTRQLCETCIMPNSEDDLCDIGLTCHFYMRRCVQIGSAAELSEDFALLQETCPVDPTRSTTWWARCITNSCVIEGRVKICPHLCINPDFPCYWVNNCQVQETMLEDCDRQCGDQAWLLSKANERFWQDSRIDSSMTCPEAKSQYGCATGIGAEVRWICPETCDTGVCNKRCREMIPREESRDGVLCQAVVPLTFSCAEATTAGIDCHCTCANYYGSHGGSLGYVKTIIPTSVLAFVGVEFNLHLTGIRLHLDYLSAPATARIKVVEGDRCSSDQSELVLGVGTCVGTDCQSRPTYSSPYYQRWDGITITGCGTFTVCYCGDDCSTNSAWANGGTLNATRDRSDDWSYPPMDNCWDGPITMDYPGPLAGKTETARSLFLSIVFVSCATSSFDVLVELLIEYLKHRSLGVARPKEADITVTPYAVDTGFPDDDCAVNEVQIATYSEESQSLTRDRIQAIADDMTRFVDTFYQKLSPQPDRIRLQIKLFGDPSDTAGFLGVTLETKPPATTPIPKDNTEDDPFFSTPAGIAIICVIAVVFGGTLFFVIWNWYFTRVIRGTVEISEEGYRKKVTPDVKVRDAPDIKVPNVFAAICNSLRDIRSVAKAKWRKTWEPKVYQRHEAPLKWQGATERTEEVPVNCAPYAGAIVRVAGLTSAQYNGVRGCVKEGPNDKGRYLVEIVTREAGEHGPRETKDLSLKEDNLMVVKVMESQGSFRSPSSSPNRAGAKSKAKSKPAPPNHAKSWRAPAPKGKAKAPA